MPCFGRGRSRSRVAAGRGAVRAARGPGLGQGQSGAAVHADQDAGGGRAAPTGHLLALPAQEEQAPRARCPGHLRSGRLGGLLL